jgi:prepilin-type N-terminal cleavage/methylation domain-containing protein
MRKGFTLLEMTVSLAVLAMLIYMAATSFLNLAPKYKLEKAVWELGSALQSAKFKSIFEGVSIRVKLYSESYAVEKYDEGLGLWMLREKHFLEGVKVEANNAPLFTPDGMTSGLATITLSNSWGKYKITVAITGRIKTTRI